MPKHDLTPYRGAWNMTPAEVSSKSIVAIRLVRGMTGLLERYHEAANNGDDDMAEEFMRQYKHNLETAVNVYIDCLLSTYRNRVRSMKF